LLDGDGNGLMHALGNQAVDALLQAACEATKVRRPPLHALLPRPQLDGSLVFFGSHEVKVGRQAIISRKKHFPADPLAPTCC
jgi:hypothetical protein